MTARFNLYTRSGCHLCEEMLETLSALPGADRFSIHLIDIDADPVLQRKFSLRIPVLADAESGKILCEQRLDTHLVLEYLGTETPA